MPTVTDWATPVSYTHLDVYKRQHTLTVLHAVHPILFAGHILDVVQLEARSQDTRLRLTQGTVAVSYTHLDVYKRQDFGITTTNMMEASLNRVMMQTAQKTIVLADSSKFGRKGFSKIADMEDVDHIITDSRIPPSTALRLEEMGIEVTIADSVHHNSI